MVPWYYPITVAEKRIRGIGNEIFESNPLIHSDHRTDTCCAKLRNLHFGNESLHT